MKYVSTGFIALVMALICVFSFMSVDKPAAASEKVRWEYTVFSFGFATRAGDIRKLNELGEDGWELVAIEPSVNPQFEFGAYVFKRKKQ